MFASQKLSDQGAEPQTPASKVAERLLVHARLCRQMASASLDEAIGEQLLKLASECVREAAETLAPERVADRTGGKPQAWRPAAV
jgi:hypothetical protein